MEANLNYQQAAEMLGVSKRTLERRVARRKIPFIRIGGRVLFRPSQLEKFLTGLMKDCR